MGTLADVRPRFAAVLLGGVLVVAGCSGETTAGPLDYDQRQPLELEQPSETRDGDLVVRELSYASDTDRVDAYLVFPAARRGRPARRPPPPRLGRRQGADAGLREAPRGPGNGRADDHGAVAAEDAAARGSPRPTASAGSATRRSATSSLRGVALDVLEADDRVDDDRLGLVGCSMGGRQATLVAGVDDRVRATILISAGASPVSEYVAAAPAELRDDVEDVLPEIDPLSYVGDIAGALLIQIGRDDSVVPQDALENVVEAAPEGTRVERYQADHGLDATAERARVDWLVERLEVKTP